MKGSKLYEIVVAEAFSPEAISRLQQIGQVTVLNDAAPETMMAALTTADALLVRSKAHVTARIIDAAPNLKVIGRASATADHIDLRAARRRNIHVVYAPQVAVTSTAEFTLAMIMALHRRLHIFDRQIREGQFDALRSPAGREMSRETLGLWGLDPVAERLGKLVTTAFGLRILYHDPAGRDPVDFKGEAVDMETLLAESDFLSMHLPQSAETKGILNAQRIAKLKPTAVVVNTARGSLIDTVALAHALKKGDIAGAGLDVFEVEPLPADHPIRRAPRCILTPHVAGATLDASSERFNVADDVVRVLTGELPHFPVPLPEGT